jgi:Ca2+-binding RTX toxin-like protein
VLTGGSGQDTLTGGSGNDTLNSRDAAADGDHCNGGSDTVVRDFRDFAASDCEHVKTS